MLTVVVGLDASGASSTRRPLGRRYSAIPSTSVWSRARGACAALTGCARAAVADRTAGWADGPATGWAPGYVKRSELYALARVTGRESDALALARRLYAGGPQNHTPTLQMLLLVLEAHENPGMDVAARAIEIFGTAQKAYDALSTHWFRTRERFPVYGVAEGLRALEKQLAISPEDSVLNQPPPPPRGPDDWFRE